MQLWHSNPFVLPPRWPFRASVRGGATEFTQSSGHAVIDIKPQVHVRFMNSMLEEGAGKKEL
jgi:hypothetical protein